MTRQDDEIELLDRSTLSIDVDEVTVDLVHRDPRGELSLGIMLTPSEAETLAFRLSQAARRVRFTLRGQGE